MTTNTSTAITNASSLPIRTVTIVSYSLLVSILSVLYRVCDFYVETLYTFLVYSLDSLAKYLFVDSLSFEHNINHWFPQHVHDRLHPQSRFRWCRQTSILTMCGGGGNGCWSIRIKICRTK